MSVEKYTSEELKEMSLIEVAFEVMNGGKTPYTFNEIMKEVARLLELSDEEVNEKIAQFYTDINIDGRFLSLGDNRWGLRTWYPVDKSEEDIVTVTKPKKKKAKKVAEEDFDDFDDVEDEDFDDFDEDLDDEDLLDDDEDVLEEDLDEDDDEDDFEEDLDDEILDIDEDLDDEEEIDDEDEFDDEDEEDR